MRYRVVLMPNAVANLEHYYRHAAQYAPQTASKWLARFQAAIQGLSSLPTRWQVAPEGKELDNPVRQMLFGKRQNVFRVLFDIVGDEVRVLHVRRSTMDLASLEEIYPESSEE